MASRFGRFRGFTQALFGDRPQPAPRPAAEKIGQFVRLEERDVPATFVVTNILDNQQDAVGGLSLRQAILAANSNPGFDRIEFNIPRSPSLPTVPGLPLENYFPIVLASTLPDLTDPAGVTIDATSQPRVTQYLTKELIAFTDDNGKPQTKFVPVSPEDPRNLEASRPLVQLLPDPNPGAFPGLKGAFYVSGPNNVIRGFAITGFPGSAVNFVGPDAKNNVVLSNWINTDISGTQSWNQDPILLKARPPGTPEELTNAGPNPISNPKFVLGGITITGGASENIIGGTSDAAGRALVDAGGTVLGEGGFVVRSNDPNTAIPVSPAINRNVISGTREFRKDYYNYIYWPTGAIKTRERDIAGSGTGPGVRIMDPGSGRNLIQGNFIGTDFTGTAAVPNINGIEIFNAASDNFIGNPTVKSDPDLGPVVSGVGNLIRFNDYDGVRVAAHPNPAQRTTRIIGMVDPAPVPFDEGDDVTTVTPTGAVGVFSGFGPASNSPFYNGPFYDAYNPNYFSGGAPGGGGVIFTPGVTDPATGVTTIGAEVQVGATLVLRGQGLLGVTSVTFPTADPAGTRVNGVVNVIDDSRVEVIVPAGAVTGPIRVASSSGVATSPQPVVILPSPPPVLDVVSNFFPSSGQVGATVVLRGRNFQGTTAVLFNGQPSGSFQVRNGGRELVAVVPARSSSGPITVITPGGSDVTTRDFEVLTSPPPVITKLSTSSGVPGSTLTIDGAGFLGTSLVTFGANSTTAPVGTTEFAVNATGTQITVTVPTSVASPITGLVSVRAGGGDGFSALPFTVLSPFTPVPAQVSPSAGPAGTTVTINGSGFTSVNGVTFNGVPAAAFKVVSDASVTAVVPNGLVAGGQPTAVNVAVTTAAAPGGVLVPSASGGAVFTVQPSAQPVANSLAAVQENTVATVFGQNLLSVSKVVFGPTPTTGLVTTNVTRVNNTQFQVVVPVGATTGNFFVFTDGGVSQVNAAAGQGRVTVVPLPPPAIALDPLPNPVSGVEGQTITFTGSGLLGTQQVLFSRPANGGPGGVVASPSVKVLDDRTVTAVVPAGAGTGPVTLVTPTDPIAAVNGQRVTLTSTGGGLSGATVNNQPDPRTQVFFTDANGMPIEALNASIQPSPNLATRDTQITVIVPAGAVAGPVQVLVPSGQLLTVQVTLPDGQPGGATTADFTVLPAPAPTITYTRDVTGAETDVSLVVPKTGPVGSIVTVTGTGFTSFRQLTVNGVVASEVTVLSDTQLRFRVPAGATTGAIAITTAGGTVATRDVFLLQASPPASITFSTPGAARGTPVTINGVGLLGTQQVLFNTVPAQFTVVSDRQLTAIVPDTATPGVIQVIVPGNPPAVSPTPFELTSATPPFLQSVTDLAAGGVQPAVAGPSAGPVGSKFSLNDAIGSNGSINGAVFDVQLIPVQDRQLLGGLSAVNGQIFGGTSARLIRDPLGGDILFFEVPELAPGEYAIAVAAATKGGGKLTSDVSFNSSANVLGQVFTFGQTLSVLPNARPTLTGISAADTDGITQTPVPITRGAPIRLTGSGFTGANRITITGPGTNVTLTRDQFFGQNTEDFRIISDTEIVTDVPFVGLPPGDAAVNGLTVQVFTPSGAVGDPTDDLGSIVDGNADGMADVPLNVQATRGIGTVDAKFFGGFGSAQLADSPFVAVYGGTVRLITPAGTSFYGVSALSMKVDVFDDQGAQKGTSPFIPAVRFHEPADPAPFLNFIVVPGTGGREALVQIPTGGGLAKIPDKGSGAVTVRATTNNGDVDIGQFTIGKAPTVATTAVQSLVDNPLTGAEELYYNRKIRIFGSADPAALTGILATSSVAFDGTGGKIIIPRENFRVVPPGTFGPAGASRGQFAIDIILPTNISGLAVPTGNITLTTVDGNTTATFTPEDQPAAQLFEFQTVTAPPQNNQIVNNLIYQNGPLVGDVRDGKGNLTARTTDPDAKIDQLVARTTGAMGIDFVTVDPFPVNGFTFASTKAPTVSARQYPFTNGYARLVQQEIISFSAGGNLIGGLGNQGRGGVDDGLAFTGTGVPNAGTQIDGLSLPVGNSALPTDFNFDSGQNTFNNVQGGRFFGPNLLQNFPLLQVVQSSVDRTTFSTALLGKPFRTYRIDYFFNPQFDGSDPVAADTTVAPYGQVFLGSKVITTDFQGNGRINFTIFQKLPAAGQTEEQLDFGPGEFKLPDNRPISNDGGVVTTTATDVSPVGRNGATVINGPDGTSRFSFFREADNATGALASAIILDANRDGKATPTAVVRDPRTGAVLRTIPGEFGTGVPNAQVEVFADRGDGTYNPQPILTSVTDTSGGFAFTDGQGGGLGLPNGVQLVRVTLPANKGFQFVPDASDLSNTVSILSPTVAELRVQILNGELVALQEIDTDADGVGDRITGPRLLVQRVVSVPPTLPPTSPPGTVPPGTPVPPTSGPSTLAPADRLLANGADAGGGPVVGVYNPDRSFRFSFLAYDPSFTGGVRTAVADVTGDRLPDIITAPGPGMPGVIKVFDGTSGQLVSQFQPYEQSFTGGVYVAASDVNSDGVADIVTGTGEGGGPRVQVFSGGAGLINGQPLVLSNFFPYEDSFRGGVLVTAGFLSSTDVPVLDEAGVPTGATRRQLTQPVIVTGTGVGGGPRVQVFDAGTLQPLFNFFAYESTFRGGVFASIGDVDGNGRSEIITGTGVGGGPVVKVFDQSAFGSVANPAALATFLAYDPNFRGGVRVDALDGGVPGGPGQFDGRADIVTAPGPGLFSDVRVIDFFSLQDVYRLQPFDPSFLGGVFIGAGR